MTKREIFWNTPGPSGFIEDFVREIAAGKSIILQTPEEMPADFLNTLRTSVRSDMTWIELESSDKTLAIALKEWSPFIFQDKPPSLATIRLVASELAGRCFFMDCRAVNGLQWNDLLVSLWEYQTIMRGLSSFERSLIVLYAPAYAYTDSVKTDTNLSSLIWSDRVAPSDINFFLQLINSKVFSSNLEKRIHYAVASELSIWDSTLASELFLSSLSEILKPGNLLRDYAQHRHWDQYNRENSSVLVDVGIVQKIDGRYVTHSAFYQINGDYESIQRRIWYALVSVLLPYIENSRLLLIERYSASLHVPFTNKTTGELVSEKKQIEIGSVAFMFRKSRYFSIPARVMDYADWLRELRNQLAHCKAVDYDMLMKYIYYRINE